MIKTKFQDIIGTKYPIIQAGMGPYSTTELCVAVAKAGALGIISTIGMAAGTRKRQTAAPSSAARVFGTGTPKEIIKRAINHVITELRDYPDAVFGVNCPVSVEFLFAAKPLIEGTIETIKENEEVAEKLKVIITSAGDPLPWAIDAKAKGAKKAYIPIKEMESITWCHVVPSVRTAQRVEKADADVIIASGREGGAHCAWRDVSSLVLLPEVVKTVKKPVVGAGGFADGASLAAALALGAIGVQMGTRFIATQESDFQQSWKEKLVRSAEVDTLVGRGIFGPMRFVRSPQTLKIVDATIKGASELFKGNPVETTSEILGLEMEGLDGIYAEDDEKAGYLGGVVTGRIHSIPTASELIQSIMTEAEEIIKNLPQKVLAKEVIH
ncbi:MAG: nitronate monooxygenase [Candidatus Helarchaeota archaeon]|nr:nitronate monooxygenase [Candidatus Helarchaeota archaeon]